MAKYEIASVGRNAIVHRADGTTEVNGQVVEPAPTDDDDAPHCTCWIPPSSDCRRHGG